MMSASLDFSARENASFKPFYTTVQSISTTTILKGKPSTDFLNDRVLNILELNPWLGGRLISKNEKVQLDYTIPVQLKNVFQISEKPETAYNVESCIDSFDYFNEFLVPTPGECLDKDESLFRVTLINFNEDISVLITSLSHLVADGHTFYKLYGMLHPAVSPYPLQAERVKEAEEKVSELAKESDDFWVSLATVDIPPPQPTTRSFGFINKTWLQEEKEKYQKTKDLNDILKFPEYITTNDLITSSFLKTAEVDIGMMATNFRNRVKEINDLLAGNYGGGNVLLPEDFKNPKDIRRSIPLMRRVVSTKPLTTELFKKDHLQLGFITNWASLYQHVEFHNCEQILHIPLYEDRPTFFNVAIVFMAKKDRPALMTFELNFKVMEKMLNDGIVEKVF